MKFNCDVFSNEENDQVDGIETKERRQKEREKERDHDSSVSENHDFALSEQM